MLRHAYYLVIAADALALLAQSSPAQAQGCRFYRGYCHHHSVSEPQLRFTRATIEAIAGSPFYGRFGGYGDAAAAARYFGPNERRYFDCGRHFGYGPDGG
jgi:hypothetical protein